MRESHLQIRLSASEREELDAAAAREGLTVTAFIRSAALKEARKKEANE